MSFSISKRGQQHNTSAVEDVPILSGTELYIVSYTDKSFVVMGDTLNHSGALVSLGGKYNPNLRIGQGWIFSKIRQESVENYIKTGEIVPYVYSKEDQAKYTKKSTTVRQPQQEQLRKLFQDFREAFDPNEEYESSSIIEVIYQLEEKFFMATHDTGEGDEEDEEKEAEAEERTFNPNHKRLARRRI